MLNVVADRMKLPILITIFIHTGFQAHPTSYSVSMKVFFPPPGVQRVGRVIEHTPPCKAEIENKHCYTSNPPSPSGMVNVSTLPFIHRHSDGWQHCRRVPTTDYDQ